jgi:predicted RNA binding protein YcfA (HicA-like mRNA interferase family)
MFSGHEVVSKLEKLGFSKIRQKGSHVIMKKCVSSGVTIGCVVPLHKELSYGTLRGILNQACINIDEFLKQ